MRTWLVAKDVMTAPVITVRPQTTLREAAELFLRYRISGAPVVDEEGRMVGIVTEADLLRREAQPMPEAKRGFLSFLWQDLRIRAGRTVRVEEVMTREVVTATEETPVRELARRMLLRKINRIPIVREGKVVGIVTRADVLKAFARTDEELVAAVRRVLAEELGVDLSRLEVQAEAGTIRIRGEVERASDVELVHRYAATVDGVVSVDTAELRYRVEDLRLHPLPGDHPP
ncbi:MAG: CBS domain-containing protein [Armatimonadetes bacterium]|nr:CBS domain-containing protein [Armatimonadota bacterium]MDW8154828.1 CBS domain-containing protein [Armatimonadota bacterium]